MESHIRIDDGLKRGPRKRRSTTRAITPANGATQTVRASDLQNLDPETVLNRYLEEPIRQIAASYGLSDAQLYRWLHDNCEEAWRRARAAKAECNLDRAEADIDDAQDPMQLAKAREKSKASQWNLERLNPRVYGLKQELKLDLPDREKLVGDSLADSALDLFKSVRGIPVTPQPALPEPEATNADTTEENVS